MSLKISSDTIALRPLQADDSELTLAWRNHDSVRHQMYNSALISKDEHDGWLNRLSADETSAYFIFEFSGEPFGVIGFSKIERCHGTAQWSFHLRPDCPVRGAGTAMGYLALKHFFDVLGLRKLTGEVLEQNERSIHFHRKLGFHQEGLRRAHVCKDGTWSDVYEFSMQRDDWRKNQSHLYSGLFSSNSPSRCPRLLFTGGGGSLSQSLQMQWGERYDLYFADANPHGFPPTIPEARRLVIPFARDPDFADRLLELCQEHAIDLLVPGVDEELSVLAEKKGAPGWPRLLIPDAAFVDLMLDKLSCARALAAAGFDVPRTLPLDEADDIGFPLIAKPRSGRGSRGVMRLERPEQVGAYLTLYGGAADTYIAQELAVGEEYTVFVAADGGEVPRAVIPVLALEKRGITLRAKTDPNPAILEYVHRFQAHFRVSGCYNIQCMLTPEGRVLPFEVNPRISTTFVLILAAGFDPVPMALGSDAEETPFQLSGTWTLQRSWHTHITPETTAGVTS